MILVDSNAWISHLRARDDILVHHIRQQRVVTCDVVVGELALGSRLPGALAEQLGRLPHVPSPSASATRAFVERHAAVFRGSGVGWADAQIILAGSDSGSRIYSADEAVRTVWRQLGFRLA